MLIEHKIFKHEPALTKSDLIKAVKIEARVRIEALNWKKERATEQPELYSLDAVLDERQAIRDASNKAELDIEQLETDEEFQNFTW
ncbi:hypothetical protein [Pseudoalteromonas denitrificans]|uniref:Uncharacterized protein n=1 Tax=Pseudoalteromonas denitrificans DSM 6059 TaxID=1123010 RepID=A0A1I1UUF8_9GAMM|nr:hypothetical protein [Pseudoalteromonas denitrificans]SFD72493.1 hypothetical protein SAMN02745724_05295 [Pseudoalteromonas denitrificans DSM 6059]